MANNYEVKLTDLIGTQDAADALGVSARRVRVLCGEDCPACKGSGEDWESVPAEGGLQELEETQYWLELLAESEIVPEDRLSSLLQEADELTAILVTCVKKVKERKK